MYAYTTYIGDLTDVQKVVAEMNNTEVVDSTDALNLSKVINGMIPLYEEWEK